MTHQDPGNPNVKYTPDPLIAAHAAPETPTEGISRLGREKVSHHASVDDPLVVSAESLTASVDRLRREVHARSVGFLIALILITAVGIAVAVIGWRSEHFLTCQAQQNTEFRTAAATERAAQRALFSVILNPASTEADRLQASRDYYAGLIAADQQRTNAGGC